VLQHKNLDRARWSEMPFAEQMANIGSEVERALTWREKNNSVYSLKAVERALELIDLSLEASGKFTRLKELARLREAVVDFFFGDNMYSSSAMLWKKYFSCFTFAARRNY